MARQPKVARTVKERCSSWARELIPAKTAWSCSTLAAPPASPVQTQVAKGALAVRLDHFSLTAEPSLLGFPV
jgi:hypothetical protein